MGLFDYVLVECPIDGVPHPETVEWQTKSFDAPFMLKYKITADGRLLEELIHYEDRSDKTAPRGTLASFAGVMTPVHEGWTDMNYHGDVWFCGEIHGAFRDFVARFTDGQLVGIAKSDGGR